MHITLVVCALVLRHVSNNATKLNQSIVLSILRTFMYICHVYIVYGFYKKWKTSRIHLYNVRLIKQF